jgi:hypothetical protein
MDPSNDCSSPLEQDLSLRRAWAAFPNDDARTLAERVVAECPLDARVQAFSIGSVHEQDRRLVSYLVSVELAQVIALNDLDESIFNGCDIVLSIYPWWQP